MKPFYTSKTLWFNLIAIVALAAQTINSSYIISPEIQGGILAVINLILRGVTGQQIDWSAGASGSETPPGPPATAGFISLRLLLALSALAILLMLLTGCATTTATGTATGSAVDIIQPKDTPQIKAGKSLLAVKSTIVTASIATDGLCKSGKIPVETCAQAKAAYETAKPAYDAAVDAYLLMSSQGGDAATFEAALTRIQGIANNMLILAGGAK